MTNDGITEGSIGLYKLLREAGGCVQQLADELDVSRQTIYNWSLHGMPSHRAKTYSAERGIPIDQFHISSRRMGRPRKPLIQHEDAISYIEDEI